MPKRKKEKEENPRRNNNKMIPTKPMIRERLFQHRWSPTIDAIIRSSKLGPGAKLLYQIILSFIWGDKDSEAWPSQKTLSELSGYGEETIRKQLQELKTVRLIEWKQRGLGKTNLYWICEIPEHFFEEEETRFNNIPELRKNSVQEPGQNSDKVHNLNNRRNVLKDINTLESDSNRIADDEKDPPKKIRKRHPLISYWNKLPNVRVHKSPGTKTYRKAVRLINQLKAGMY